MLNQVQFSLLEKLCELKPADAQSDSSLPRSHKFISRRASSVGSDPASEYSDRQTLAIDLHRRKNSSLINVDPISDRTLYEYTLSKQPNIFKSCVSSELAAAVAAT